jgi:hypothetical protein
VTTVADRVRSRCWLIIAVVSVARSRRVSSRNVGGVLPAMLLRVGLGLVVAMVINADTGEIRPTRRRNRSRARQYQPTDLRPPGVRTPRSTSHTKQRPDELPGRSRACRCHQ